MDLDRLDIVLIQPPGWANQNPPLGLALLKSYVNQNGLSAKVYDLNITLYNLRHGRYVSAWGTESGYYLWERESWVKELFDTYSSEILHFIYSVLTLKPKAIGLSTHCSSFISAEILATKFKQLAPDIKIIFGGPQVANYTSNWERVLKSQVADAVVFGEGEESLAELLKEIDSLSDKPIAGVAYRNSRGEIVLGENRPQITSLDSLPFADFSDFDLRHYVGVNVLPTYFSRGCINSCVYCTENKYFPKFRNRSGQRVFDEVVHQLSKYPRTEFFRMHDSVSNGNIKELENFCDLIIENDVGINFNLENAVIRKEMDSRLYKKLKKAGCTLIGYGLETPSKRLLKSIGKKACLNADFDRVVTEGVRAKFNIGINMMFGLPGENDEDLKQQLDFLKKHKGHSKNITINPALNYCYFPEGCAVKDDPDKYEVDLSESELFWVSKDGQNTFIKRLNSFEEFCNLGRKLGYENLFNITESVNKNEMLGNYYASLGNYNQALNYFSRSFKSEAKTVELAERLLEMYEKTSLKEDAFYGDVVRFVEENKNRQREDASFDSIHSLQLLQDFILKCSIGDSINKFNSILEKFYQPPVRFSVHGFKSYIKHIILKYIYGSDKQYFVLLQAIKEIDNKLNVIAEKQDNI